MTADFILTNVPESQVVPDIGHVKGSNPYWAQQKPMCHLNLGNLVDVQERHITDRKCRDSGVQGGRSDHGLRQAFYVPGGSWVGQRGGSGNEVGRATRWNGQRGGSGNEVDRATRWVSRWSCTRLLLEPCSATPADGHTHGCILYLWGYSSENWQEYREYCGEKGTVRIKEADTSFHLNGGVVLQKVAKMREEKNLRGLWKGQEEDNVGSRN
ncbi:hypothetical protein J6590_088243 [Homalodisca vitripennis]|nr:hypothetical protein J6590_088243 [Homalodisca vitripennis]